MPFGYCALPSCISFNMASLLGFCHTRFFIEWQQTVMDGKKQQSHDLRGFAWCFWMGLDAAGWVKRFRR